jgi:hypothetical protein
MSSKGDEDILPVDHGEHIPPVNHGEHIPPVDPQTAWRKFEFELLKELFVPLNLFLTKKGQEIKNAVSSTVGVATEGESVSSTVGVATEGESISSPGGVASEGESATSTEELCVQRRPNSSPDAMPPLKRQAI